MWEDSEFKVLVPESNKFTSSPNKKRLSTEKRSFGDFEWRSVQGIVQKVWFVFKQDQSGRCGITRFSQVLWKPVNEEMTIENADWECRLYSGGAVTSTRDEVCNSFTKLFGQKLYDRKLNLGTLSWYMVGFYEILFLTLCVHPLLSVALLSAFLWLLSSIVQYHEDIITYLRSY